MTGADESASSSDAVMRMTESEIAKAMSECQQWRDRAQRCCDSEAFTTTASGSQRLDPDRAVRLVDP